MPKALKVAQTVFKVLNCELVWDALLQLLSDLLSSKGLQLLKLQSVKVSFASLPLQPLAYSYSGNNLYLMFCYDLRVFSSVFVYIAFIYLGLHCLFLLQGVHELTIQQWKFFLIIFDGLYQFFSPFFFLLFLQIIEHLQAVPSIRSIMPDLKVKTIIKLA